MSRSIKIAIVTSGHPCYDDRLFYHFARSLIKQGHQVAIVCSTQTIDTIEDHVVIKGFYDPYISKTKKIQVLLNYLNDYQPDRIICVEPLTVLAAKKYRKAKNKNCRIILDVTEWYPSKKNLANASFPGKIILPVKLFLFNIYTTGFCNRIMSGEYYKLIPYKFLFPFKSKEIISYYPGLAYFNEPNFKVIPGKIVLGYSGKLNHEKGFFNFLGAVKTLVKNHPELIIKLKIIGWFSSAEDELSFKEFCDQNKNIEIDFSGRQVFHQFISSIKEMDICFDLRVNDIENSHSLPIKLFYYAASGKPVIYTKLRSIVRSVDVQEFGFLVNEQDHEGISSIIENYISQPELYLTHSKNAWLLFREKYNWDHIEPAFISFITAP